ncbi:MAG: 4Fe-4S binding protein [Spirochaetes bacterium]|nr:4Fe-4S binding protein [Spirochaetota bacterium]
MNKGTGSGTMDVYEALRRRIDMLPVGMPKSATGEEGRILRHLFSPREASLACHLNAVPETTERISGRLVKAGAGFSREETGAILAELARRGSILEGRRGGARTYGLLQFVVGMFELQVNRMTPQFARDSFNYTAGAFAREINRTGIPQLRAVPINVEAAASLCVHPYDDARRLVRDTPGQFGLMNCICKQRKDLMGEPCGITDIRETCITFPAATALFKKSGATRPVSSQEILGILERAEREGLVLQMGNSMVPMVMCCCCGDCCEILVSAKALPRPATLFTTNYFAAIDPARCTRCGACADRCQMGAPAVASGTPHIDADRCIGCSLCASVCPSGALEMRRKRRTVAPPKTLGDLYAKILVRKIGLPRAILAGIRKRLGMRL